MTTPGRFTAPSTDLDEVVQMNELRKYLLAFAGCVYQLPKSICPQHQMLLPRSIKG